jgi:hypothetical protein
VPGGGGVTTATKTMTTLWEGHTMAKNTGIREGKGA